MSLIKKILKAVGYKPDAEVGNFTGTGSYIENDPLKPEPNGYQANANTAGRVNVDGGQNTDLNVRTTMKDVQDFHTNAVQELLGNPQVARPIKNDHRNVDAQLESQYFGDMRKY